ncbi:hypothetical protein JQC92_02465 [Shewanella sp. 202IG2-18]|uniref:hypothetical protein n=1 Tax=Parashewanella hymeniacidonis TaxID=2807618 RepID=UPI0019602CBB|nr:hypothetical protein [Parashewanella hymeniacidonis]MBM7070905.1 hypothetical protein [Parashewanella hymeniacidonis]
MKRLWITLPIIFLSACNSTPEPTGKWLWEKPSLYNQLDKGEVSPGQVNQTFQIIKAKCQNEALKIPLPPPSCVQQSAPTTCNNAGPLMSGFCQGYYSQPHCDYTAYNEAKSAQNQVFENCLHVQGWVKKWHSFDEKESKRPATSTKVNEESSVKDIVKSIPELYQWYQEDGKLWERAMEIDNKLANDPKYGNLPTRERFLAVVEKVRKESQTTAKTTHVTKPISYSYKDMYTGVGIEHWIKENNSQGKVIILEDGSIWKIEDNIESMLWLPIDRISVVELPAQGFYRLINKENGNVAIGKYLGK